MAFNYDEYLRTDKMPTLWCWGCGDGVILKSVIRAIDKAGWNMDDVCVVSGIGCSGRFSSYINCNTVHTTHGRTLAYATGIKLANPEKKVIVVGGGDSAIEEATFLTKFATRVHVVHRRDEVRASKVMQERAMNNEKIQFHWNSEVIEINGDEKMQQAVLKNLKTNEEKTIKVGGLFVDIGHQPNTELFKNQIDLDDEGYIVLKNKTHTNMEGVFAAGDVHDRSYRQAITAAGYGCMAAIDVDKFLTENADK